MDVEKEQEKEETKEKEGGSGKKDEKEEKEKVKEVKGDTKDDEVEVGVGDPSPPSQPAGEEDKSKEDDLCSCPPGILVISSLSSKLHVSEVKKGKSKKGKRGSCIPICSLTAQASPGLCHRRGKEGREGEQGKEGKEGSKEKEAGGKA